MSDKIANVEDILNRITDAWNYYFLENKFCQSKINYNDEVKTNYYGDILSYFHDTLSFLHLNQAHFGRKESIFNSVGLLQIIYAQQDLVDELMYIFKLPESRQEDKNPNRNIRNELVGHPIRRLNGELISSVFFGNEFKGNIIHYILYSKDNEFKLKEEILSIDKIVDRHLDFLLKYLNVIILKIRYIINHLKKKFDIILSILDGNVDFNKLLIVTEHVYEKVFEDNKLFKLDVLKDIYKRIDEHPRYRNVIEIFAITLRSNIEDAKRNIDDIVLGKVKQVDGAVIPKITFKIVKSKRIQGKRHIEKKNFDYEFSKLFENHPIFGLNYFIAKFSNNVLVMDELLNMKEFITNELEYYSSYEYLRIIMIENGLLSKWF